MFVEDGDGGLAKEAVRAGVSAYIVDGLTSSRIQPVIEVAIERFKMFDCLQRELEKSSRKRSFCVYAKFSDARGYHD